MRSPAAHPETRIWAHACLCLLYVPMTLWATWPLAARAADHVVDAVRLQGAIGWLTQADILLHTWILAWGTHALLASPGALLDANIFHPARWALVRSEHDLGDLPLFALFYLPSGNPILAHQLAILLTYVLAGVAAYAAAWRFFRRADAALLAGALFAFTPWQLASLPHIQTLPTMYLPLILMTGLEVLGGGSRRWWLALAGALVFQALCSAYLGVLGFGVAVATFLGCWLHAGVEPRRATRYAAALATAAAVALVVYWPYTVLGRTGEIPGATRAVQETFSARPLASYLPTAGGAVRFLSLPAALAGFAGLLAPTVAPRLVAGPSCGRVRAAAAAIGAAGYVLSLGPTLRLPGDLFLPLPFRALGALPGLSALRGPGRFGVLVALAASILGALGVAAIATGARRRAVGAAVTVAALAGLALEIHRIDVPLRSVETGSAVPVVYGWLASNGGGEPVLELPIGADVEDYAAIYTQSRYTYLSTYHWSPMLNGYSAYPPASFFLVMAVAQRLPDASALQDLVNLTGVRWIVLHGGALDPRARRAWLDAPGDALTRAASYGDDTVFRVTLGPTVDLRGRVAWPSTDSTTLTGVPVRPLSGDALRGALYDLEVPAVLPPRRIVQAWVTVENRSSTPWPGFRPAAAGLVHVGYRWVGAAGDGTPGSPHLARIPTDLQPGHSIRVPFPVHTPDEPGAYHLRVTVVQSGGVWFDEHGGPSAEATVDVP